MASEQQLLQTLKRIDGKGYKAYKDIQGNYNFSWFHLYVDHVQGDPFASPSLLRVRVPAKQAGLPENLFHNRVRKVALEDYLTRSFAREIRKVSSQKRGSGKSGMLLIDSCGQEILERTSMVVTSDYVEARFSAGLPARGRSVLGKEAEEMFAREIPSVVRGALLYRSLNEKEVEQHVNRAEDQDYLRRMLAEQGWIAFVGNGAVLPRKSGVSDKPLQAEGLVPFESPSSLEEEADLPHQGKIKGMAVPEGVTLVVGGGYHGKSTLLRALERGVYNHVPGDGRDLVVSREDAVKIRAEDGRRIAGVDISPFINNLPQGIDTHDFSSEDASGSTSQAANIMESLEVGTSMLMLDEDTSATNFMIRDRRMQALVSKDKEPITPFIDKVKQLYWEIGVSTVIVVGGSGDYFDVADLVIMMDEYKPHEVTSEAREIASDMQTHRREEGSEKFGTLPRRYPLSHGMEPRKGKKIKISAKSLDAIQYGQQNIYLGYVEQLVDFSQTRAIGEALYYLYRKGYLKGNLSLREVLEVLMEELEKNGLDVLSPYREQHPGYMALPRKYEVAAAINRMPDFKVRLSRNS